MHSPRWRHLLQLYFADGLSMPTLATLFRMNQSRVPELLGLPRQSARREHQPAPRGGRAAGQAGHGGRGGGFPSETPTGSQLIHSRAWTRPRRASSRLHRGARHHDGGRGWGLRRISPVPRKPLKLLGLHATVELSRSAPLTPRMVTQGTIAMVDCPPLASRRHPPVPSTRGCPPAR
jgi:hypothetical protein